MFSSLTTSSQRLLFDILHDERGFDYVKEDYLLLSGFSRNKKLSTTTSKQFRVVVDGSMQHWQMVTSDSSWQDYILFPDLYKCPGRPGQLSLMSDLQLKCFDVLQKNIKFRHVSTLEDARNYKETLLSTLKLPWQLCALFFFPCLDEINFRLDDVKILRKCNNGHPTYDRRRYLKQCFCWVCGAETFKFLK
ncbi:NAD-glutamate dehydrogenase [Alphabaculovirus altersperidaniae]|uniref:NAD-glutamate dehydrogenase n=1 Tax=Spodoptera eridania nucleopolyhedrovirus TaxID=2315721 RepID=A0ABX6TQM7_9ABAC|nr:NAD-glutamate dehydrogenase [Spodoptera eridania nucleopolyhedrovirus]QNV47780.1 NAD-glutamate dehydrogenase [Spodoptera eridania nucleopolyhedrovirus]